VLGGPGVGMAGKDLGVAKWDPGIEQAPATDPRSRRWRRNWYSV
jgi:hypothetical protein